MNPRLKNVKKIGSKSTQINHKANRKRYSNLQRSYYNKQDIDVNSSKNSSIIGHEKLGQQRRIVDNIFLMIQNSSYYHIINKALDLTKKHQSLISTIDHSTNSVYTANEINKSEEFAIFYNLSSLENRLGKIHEEYQVQINKYDLDDIRSKVIITEKIETILNIQQIVTSSYISEAIKKQIIESLIKESLIAEEDRLVFEKLLNNVFTTAEITMNLADPTSSLISEIASCFISAYEQYLTEERIEKRRTHYKALDRAYQEEERRAIAIYKESCSEGIF
jgi:vacuolar-type H+-ATPase subunit I/STV1